jgi:ABC-2 type transport system permease protein
MMLALIKKELRSLFLNPISLTVISILNVAPVVAFAVYLGITQSTGAYAGFESMVSLMAIIIALLIPLVSARAMSSERKNGTDDFLLSLPISKTSVILS